MEILKEYWGFVGKITSDRSWRLIVPLFITIMAGILINLLTNQPGIVPFNVILGENGLYFMLLFSVWAAICLMLALYSFILICLILLVVGIVLFIEGKIYLWAIKNTNKVFLWVISVILIGLISALFFIYKNPYYLIVMPLLLVPLILTSKIIQGEIRLRKK